ncbi:MAG TPA: hypothetical protein VHQ65_05910 [Thermoanaerobaculia bacterium]|nr:hypothetical protein [Thermoanaerobaculia bacterium]
MNDSTTTRRFLHSAAAAAALLALTLPGSALAQIAPVDTAPGERGVLARAAAASYRQAARYPASSRPVAPGAADPVLAQRVPAPHSMPGRTADSPVLSVWSREVSFQAPAAVELHASLDQPRGGKSAPLEITGEVVRAGGEAVGRVTYRDDGEGADTRKHDGVYSARFEVPADLVPEVAESFAVRVRAVTGDGEEIGTTGGFLYGTPDARLTGRYRDEVRDGNLVIAAEVKVEAAGRFHVAGTLYSMKGEPVGWAQAAAELAPGVHWLELSYYGLMFHDRGAAGPFRLGTVALSTTTTMPNALNDLVENAHQTRAYPLARFESRPFGEPGLTAAAARLEASASGGER